MKGGIVLLTEGRPWKCILRFALPLFLGSLLQQMYYTVDAMMVGRLAGEQALSGVGTCAVLTNLLIAFSTGFSAGSSIVSAQYFGAGQYQGIAKNAFATMSSLTVLGFGIGGLSIGLGKQMLRLFVSVPETLLDYAGTYFCICAAGFLFQFIYNGVAALLRSIGDSKASLYFLMLSTALNIVLDYCFLAWFDMGVAGAAWATVISQFFACIVRNAFNSEQNIQLQQIAETGLKLYFTAIPFVGFNIIISSYFTSTEKALPAQLISLSRGFFVIIPMAYFLAFLLKMTGVWLSFPITECFVTLAGIALYIKSERGKKNV